MLERGVEDDVELSHHLLDRPVLDRPRLIVLVLREDVLVEQDLVLVRVKVVHVGSVVGVEVGLLRLVRQHPIERIRVDRAIVRPAKLVVRVLIEIVPLDLDLNLQSREGRAPEEVSAPRHIERLIVRKAEHSSSRSNDEKDLRQSGSLSLPPWR